ncbi:MAG: DsbA family protein [Aquidulcibacter sp.]|jgi:protein-disulfide isomerase|uniref:DsbA family protein n=1 Tax=Aquidulcibacter sp. TaxID=2052990 RepID=UPI0022BFFA76|nr:DsbA family protein [Aquidulcibacter sp.]MCE2890144.1 DsbA family protein [Hyphomonadaceae bacterium]MCZ8210030.1 DsbA family protein [Aquidulcibacter sp.]
MSIQFRTFGFAAKLAFVATALALSACSPSTGGKSGGAPSSALENATDFPMGSKDAKVVMIEYASITCPHCANFHTNVLPTIKEKYITPGKVRYVFREFPTMPVELATAGHLLARCAGGEKRDQVIDVLMRGQSDLVTQAQGPSGAKQALLNVAVSVGMNEGQFDACMANQDQLKILVEVQEGGVKAGVQGTPAIFINGEKFEGPGGREMTADDVSKALDAALAKAK